MTPIKSRMNRLSVVVAPDQSLKPPGAVESNAFVRPVDFTNIDCVTCAVRFTA